MDDEKVNFFYTPTGMRDDKVEVGAQGSILSELKRTERSRRVMSCRTPEGLCPGPFFSLPGAP